MMYCAFSTAHQTLLSFFSVQVQHQGVHTYYGFPGIFKISTIKKHGEVAWDLAKIWKFINSTRNTILLQGEYVYGQDTLRSDACKGMIIQHLVFVIQPKRYPYPNCGIIQIKSYLPLLLRPLRCTHQLTLPLRHSHTTIILIRNTLFLHV